jgi:hypothetical protein
MRTDVESVRIMCIRFSLQGVCRFELPRLSDISNRLSYGSHQVDNLMKLMVVYWNCFAIILVLQLLIGLVWYDKFIF